MIRSREGSDSKGQIVISVDGDDDEDDQSLELSTEATSPPSEGTSHSQKGKQREMPRNTLPGWSYGRYPFVDIVCANKSLRGVTRKSDVTGECSRNIVRNHENGSRKRSNHASESKQRTLSHYFGVKKAAEPRVQKKQVRPKPLLQTHSRKRLRARESDDDGSDASFREVDSSESDDDVEPEKSEDEGETDSDVPSSHEECNPKTKAVKAQYGKRGVWEPSFRAGKPIKRLPFVPTLEQAFAHEKKARLDNERGQYPPISDLADIFADIVKRTPAIPELAKALQTMPLRVATMCSGTESPLLALNLISRAVKDQHGMRIDVEHVFSCEIEPYKQAYIERNFAPPILFRDVCELGNDVAHTAYGSLVKVPGNVDLLVAGTSCVDYSNLNTKKKGVEEGGESGRTFFGMLQWVKRHRPPIVILENVKSAPWAAVGTFFEEIGYDAAWSNTFDTKNYYIPHTRQRGYLIATSNRNASYAGNWEALTRSLARPASSTLEAFLLAPDDPRLNRVRTQFAQDEGSGKGRSSIDWSKCQGRHERARDEENLGNGRPFTAWEEGGTCHLSHGAWNEWAVPQPERVLDLLDITILRAAKNGVDPHYKSRVWELSQNVDRNIASARPGTCMCLTPSGMPYVTSRGGPLVGLEALSLQGLPIDELLLTRENNDQLQNLAGNAMSSTVVGTCVLAALVIARQDLEERRSHIKGDMANDKSSAATITERVETRDGSQGTQVVGRLDEDEYDVVTCEHLSISSLLREAVASSQRCVCEGREAIADAAIYRCKECQHTTCARCKSRPEHVYEEDKSKRKTPASFAKILKRALPMRFVLGGLQHDELLQDIEKSTAKPHKEHKAWVRRISDVLGEGVEMHFSELLRQKNWLVRFTSTDALLELCLDPRHPHWRLFVAPAAKLAASHPLRKLLSQPVARLALDKERSSTQYLLEGEWQICLPLLSSMSASIRYHGDLIPTWEAAMGIGGEYAIQKRFTRLDVDIASDGSDGLDCDITGSYRLLPKCATANGGLHVRVEPQKDDAGKEDVCKADLLFLFLDPDRFGERQNDGYVFSHDIDKLPFPLERVTVARMPKGWRPKAGVQLDEGATSTVTLSVEGRWVTSLSLRLGDSRQFSSSLGMMKQCPNDLPSCDQAIKLAICSALVLGEAKNQWPKAENVWLEVDLEHHALNTFRELAWLTERIALPNNLASWTSASVDSNSCARCAPQPPRIQWQQVKNKAPVPVENEQEAGPFEQRLKNRPQPFVVQLMRSGDEARVRIAVNPTTLMHRAKAQLPFSRATAGKVEVAWRVIRADRTLELFNLPRYTLMSNRKDQEAPTPSIFKLPLRKEQKRSLQWMLAQERDDAAPFLEEEVAEGALSPLGWRVEGKATRNVLVKGGVLADAVGYGKTCITLGLIAAAREVQSEKMDCDQSTAQSHIRSKATLVIVPPHLCKQWESEVRKFCGSRMSVKVIYSKANLNSMPVREMMDADIVIMSVTVYKSDTYFESLSQFAAANRLPLKPGRYFDAALQCSLRGLRNRVRELHSAGADKVLESIKHQVDYDASQYTTFKKSKRLVGQAYADANRKHPGKDHEEVAQDCSSDDENQLPKERLGLGNDIWGLKSKSARQDWRNLSALPLEAYKWARVVIDEFHYVAENADRAYSAIRELEADATWILSGTPPTADFADVKTIASFLKIHLGVDDDQDSLKASVRSRREKARTKAEQFRSYVGMRSAEWHHRRQSIGQRFLDRFVRQNVAEIDEIDSQVHIRRLRMPAAERACYLELAHMIEALDLRHARRLFKTATKAVVSTEGKKKTGAIDSGNDRDDRLRKTLGESASPEEALSRQASHFILANDDGARMANAIEACNYIVAERKRQRDECFEQMQRDIPLAMEQHFIVLLKRRFRDDSRQALVTFAQNVEKGAWGDNDSKPVLVDLLRRLACTSDGLSKKAGQRRFPHWKTAKEDKELDWLEERKIRDMVHMLQRLRNEFVSREQSLRYFQLVRDIQSARSDPSAARDLDIRCPSSKCNLGGRKLEIDEIALASTCGHAGCRTCIVRDSYINKCCTEACFAVARPASVVFASSLGHETDTTTAYGIKLATIATLIKTRIPQSERILVFVQFEGLLRRVAEAFYEYGIEHVRLRGSASARSTQLDDFQTGQQRVLLLSIADESAAGSNLTVANHVIFLGPLIAEEAQQYHATMEQARGRAVRFGQTRKVHIWRFAVCDTIDQQVLQAREGITLDSLGNGNKADDDDADDDDDDDVYSRPMPLIDVSHHSRPPAHARAGQIRPQKRTRKNGI